ncbi:MAG: single-stranded DNA-binding protein [Campylobacterales bacterium]|nr:single-stranded DNA-binding protein [Campylobacterales bacterium]
MFNKIILVGNLTRDIELRYAQTGTAIAKTGIATSRKFGSGNERKEETMFIDITFFARSAEVANQYLRKGSKVLIEGRLQLEQWVDQSGQKRSRHSVIVETMQMLDGRNDAPSMSGGDMHDTYEPSMSMPAYSQPSYQQPKQPSPPVAQRAAKMPENNLPEIDINEDEIPF